ncbi:Tripeptidyl-peptidase 2 [Camellia lanceoleosa]|uniref:Tripeptidyl-peptidase 2 n=1 Tax=Camellia lanceoleosa TaxID=1840588 RepID=A0ACC0IVN9_9ERIC|nr:Tripeptidyl-peptidase 2 [Camellia lanceoleosa]
MTSTKPLSKIIAKTLDLTAMLSRVLALLKFSKTNGKETRLIGKGPIHGGESNRGFEEVEWEYGPAIMSLCYWPFLVVVMGWMLIGIVCSALPGLALRENILRVNGSDICPWWIKHHYFAMAMALISLTWETQKQRGVQLFLQWAIMQGVAMLLQNRYQRQRLCTHIALGMARRMDIVWGETAGVDGQLWLLAPILFILQRVYTMGDVYPNSTKLSKGEYNLQLYLRHDNVQYLEKMKQLVLFIERNLEDKVGSIKRLISRCGDGFHKEELL